MADYVAREWSGGDIVTAANLNHLEQGVESAQGGGVLIIEESVTEGDNITTYTLNKTWQEINDAMISGTICLVHRFITDYESYASVVECGIKGSEYTISTFADYITNNSTGYPRYTGPSGSGR